MNYVAMSDFELNTAIVYNLYAKRLITRILFPDTPNKESKIQVVKDGIWCWFDPCNNPEDAWPIIVASRISISAQAEYEGYGWVSYSIDSDVEDSIVGANPLRCAMIMFLMMLDAKKPA